MANFNQAQSELDAFLDENFAANPAQEQNTTEEETKEDDVISSYLAGDEDDSIELNSRADEVQTTQQVQATQQAQTVPSEQERILNLERELAAVRTRAQMYENALTSQIGTTTQQAQQPQKPNLAFGDEELKIDERYFNDYGDSTPLMQQVARQVANDLYQRAVLPLQQELAQVRGNLTEQQNFNLIQSRENFGIQLQQMIPEIGQIASSNEWQSYIQQPAPFSGGTRTIANVVRDGIQSGNLQQVAEIVNDFKAKKASTQPAAQQVAPGRAQTVTPNTQQRVRVLKMSDFDRATADFRAGRLSWDKYQRLADEFNAASVEGRVNYSK